MAIKKTKKLSAQTVTTSVGAGEKFAKVDANGKVTLIDLGSLKNSLLGGLNLNCMMDGVFIMTHRKLDDMPQAIKPHLWPALQSKGETADGVALMEGGKILVVAPTDASLPWSSADVVGGGVATADREIAINDWNGKANTASIVAASTSTAVTNTNAYAAGFCNLYARQNANGHGMTAGKWWLPSVGELMMIKANLNKLNYCLSLIAGATQINGGSYWTSTETNSSMAWCLYVGDGGLTSWTPKISLGTVRPVSTFIR